MDANFCKSSCQKPLYHGTTAEIPKISVRGKGAVYRAVQVSCSATFNRIEVAFCCMIYKNSLTGIFTAMLKLKYSSVVVKKLMETANGKYASEITIHIIESRHFLSVLVDPYGFDVLQCALAYYDGTFQKTLNHQIRQHSDLQELLVCCISDEAKQKHEAQNSSKRKRLKMLRIPRTFLEILQENHDDLLVAVDFRNYPAILEYLSQRRTE